MDAFFDRLWHYQSVVGPKALEKNDQDNAANPPRGTTEETGKVVSNDSVGESSCNRFHFPRSISDRDKDLQDRSGDSERSPFVPVSGSKLSGEFPAWSHTDPGGVHDRTAAPTNHASTCNKNTAKHFSRTRTELRNSGGGGGDLQLLRKVFDFFDKNKDGRVSVEELSGSLEKLGLEAARSNLSELMGTVATEGIGYVDFNQFVSLFESVGRDAVREQDEEESRAGEEDVEEAFRVFDMNGDGLISSSELSTILRILGIYEGGEGRDYEKMIEKVDLDGNGYIDIFEFKNMLHAIHVPK